MNPLPSEVAAILAVTVPDSRTAGTVRSGDADMSMFESCMIIITVGEMAATSTLDAVVHQADSAGANDKVLSPSSKTITQLTATDDDKQIIINVRAEDMDMANDFSNINLNVTVANAAVDYGVVILGFNPRYAPASDNDVSTVDEIVS